MLRTSALPCLFVLCTLSCGGTGANQPPRATAPLSAEDAELFNDGIDMLDKPEMLQDTWRQQWAEDTQRLADRAQLVARGEVTTLRTEQDPDMRTTVDVVLHVKEVLLGDHSGGDLVLRSRAGAVGFGSVQEHRQRVLRADMVAFVRYALEGGQQVMHFQLVRPSGPVLNAVDKRLGKEPHRVKIIEHTQE
jgi:hypothetical protein